MVYKNVYCRGLKENPQREKFDVSVDKWKMLGFLLVKKVSCCVVAIMRVEKSKM